MDYSALIWTGATQSSLCNLDGVENVLFSIMQPLSHRRKIAKISLLYCNFHGSCSGKLHPLHPLIITFAFKTHHVTYIVENHLHLLRHPFMRSKFHRAASSCRQRLCKNDLHDHVSRSQQSYPFQIFPTYLHNICL